MKNHQFIVLLQLESGHVKSCVLVYMPHSKMAENTLFFSLNVNWPLLPRFHLQNSKEYLAEIKATRAN